MNTVLKMTKEIINKSRNPKFLINISGGYTIPAYETDFWKTYDPGACFNIGCGYIFNKLLTLRLDLQYNMFPSHTKNSIYIKRKFYIEKSEMSFSTAKLDLLINNPIYSTINLYGIIGGGIYFLTKGSLLTPGDLLMRLYHFGVSAGGGISIKLSEKAIYIYLLKPNIIMFLVLDSKRDIYRLN